MKSAIATALANALVKEDAPMSEINFGPSFETPSGGTISAFGLHHRLKLGVIEADEIEADDDGYITRVVTPDGEYVLVQDGD